MNLCRNLITAVLLILLLSSCSMVRVGYDKAQTVSYWWLDGYFDFSESQELQVNNDLREFHQWHRSTQLPDYADMLAAIGAKTPADFAPASVCEYIDEVRTKLDTFAVHAVPYLARIARQLSPAQMDHLRKKFAAEDKTWREKWIDPTSKALAEARFDDWEDRADSFYGDITSEQKAFMKNAIAGSVFDPRISWDHRQLRQQDMLATFIKISESGMSQSAAEIDVKALFDRWLHAKDPVYQAMFDRLLTESCVNLAGLHQLTTQRQRLRAQEKLAGYEWDFRVLSKN
jgi:Family of unknown function (DUF6279)